MIQYDKVIQAYNKFHKICIIKRTVLAINF